MARPSSEYDMRQGGRTREVVTPLLGEAEVGREMKVPGWQLLCRIVLPYPYNRAEINNRPIAQVLAFASLSGAGVPLWAEQSVPGQPIFRTGERAIHFVLDETVYAIKDGKPIKGLPAAYGLYPDRRGGRAQATIGTGSTAVFHESLQGRPLTSFLSREHLAVLALTEGNGPAVLVLQDLSLNGTGLVAGQDAAAEPFRAPPQRG